MGLSGDARLHLQVDERHELGVVQRGQLKALQLRGLRLQPRQLGALRGALRARRPRLRRLLRALRAASSQVSLSDGWVVVFGLSHTLRVV